MAATKHTTCTVPECGRKHRARGYCSNHYNAWSKQYETRTCSIADCMGILHSSDLCKAHYLRQWRHGSTDARSDRTLSERFWANVGMSGDCWEWQGGTSAYGYGVFSVGSRENRRQISAHRFSCEIHHGPLAPGEHVLHSCDNPPCVNPAHLRAGTHAENMRDMSVRERVNTTKLTAETVKQVRTEYAEGESMVALAGRYSVSPSNIGRIVKRETWKHVA